MKALFTAILFLDFFLFSRFAASYDNVLIITVDTLRADHLSCYGSTKVQTPHTDELARNGILFRNAVTVAPITLPAHASLFTGLIPPAHGVHDNGFTLDSKAVTLAEIFRANGYRTAAFVGSFSVDSRFGLNQGFEIYDDSYPVISAPSSITISERKADEVVNSAMKWLQNHSNDKWFVWIHLFDPHYPYNPPAEEKKIYATDLYSGEVAYVDLQIGRLLDFFKQIKQDSSTLIILTSDHGESLGEHEEKTHGIFAYESTLRIPLVIAPFKAATVLARATIIDIAPTVLELMGISTTGKMQGTSLKPLFSNEPGAPVARDSYFEALSMYLTAGWAPLRGFYSGDYKYIQLPIPELYQITKDPSEKNDFCKDAQLCKEWQERFTRSFPSIASASSPVLDAEAAERLQALGYVATGAGRKSEFTTSDDPKNLISLHDRAYAALTEFNHGRTDAAVELLNKIIQERPKYSEPYQIKAFIESVTGHPENAAETIKTAMTNGISSSDLEGKLGLYLYQSGKYKEATEHLQAALRIDPRNLNHMNFLAQTYEKMNEPARAEETLLSALKMDPDDAMTSNNLGAFYLRQERFKPAAEKFQMAIAANPYVDNAYSGLATAQEKLQNWNEAIRVWKMLLERQPENSDALLHTGLDLLQLGRSAEALEYLRRFERGASPDRYYQILPKIRTLIHDLEK